MVEGEEAFDMLAVRCFRPARSKLFSYTVLQNGLSWMNELMCGGEPSSLAHLGTLPAEFGNSLLSCPKAKTVCWGG